MAAAVAVLAAGAPVRAEPQLVAVLPLDVSRTNMTPADQATLEEAIRTISAEVLTPEGFTVLANETQIKVLTDNGIDPAKACDASCALEAAQNLKARLFISGSVTTSEGEYVAYVRLYESTLGRQYGKLSIEGSSVRDLRRSFSRDSRALFQRLIEEERARKAPSLGRKLSWGLVALGGGAAVAGGVLGWKSRSLVAANEPRVEQGATINSISEVKADQARGFALGANVLFGVAATAIVGGAAGVWFTAPSAQHGGVAVAGRF